MINKIEHRSAGGVVFDTNRKLGYYVYNNEVYYNKLHVLMAASQTQSSKHHINGEPIKWFFNDDVFVKYPWHIEPELSMTELYRQRAQQLRDQYDYIRIECSGGSDSVTAVFSFILNGIHLDEIVYRYPKQGDKDATNDPWVTKPENTLSEWQFAAKPLLDWVATHSPETKITFYDYSDNMIKNVGKEDASWIFKTRHFLQPSHAHKHTNLGLIENVADRKQRIAVVYGLDKPKVCIKNNKFFLSFFDTQANQCNPDLIYDNVTNELFFWSPDMPELVCKQAHEVCRWFSQPENYKFQHALHWPNNDFSNRQLYEQLVRAIIYPDYDSSTFQTSKPTNNIWNEMDYWFHTNFKDTDLYSVWQSGISHLLNNLDPKYIGYVNGRPTNIKDFMTPFFYLGECSIPEQFPVNARAVLQQARNDQRVFTHVINGKIQVY